MSRPYVRPAPRATAAHYVAACCLWLLGALAAGLVASEAARAEVVWLCKPGMADNPCEIPLDTTVREPDGSERVETPARPPEDRRAVDCFYVYPTVSNQPTPNATKSRDPELESIAKYQAARFSSHCRTFAPIYRQSTIAGLATSSQEERNRALAIAYADVAEAWREYLAKDNRGRGVVLIGHSQGTRMLRALLRLEIDRSAEARRLLVGAVLLGGNVTVARGSDRGGDFQHVPVCRRPGQFGCVVAFSTYAEDPPPDSRYGRVDALPDDPFGFPSGDAYEVACTEPAVLSGMTGPFGITTPSEPFAPGVIAAGTVVVAGGPPPSAPTTWVTPPDRFRGACRTINGANVYRFDPLEGSRRPNYFPDETWGTHLMDVNLGYERQVAIVGRQAQAWLSRGDVRGERAGCASDRRLRLVVSPQRVRAGTRTRFRLRVTRRVGGRAIAVRRARVRFAGRELRTNRAGRATLRLTLRRPGARRAHAFAPGSCRGSARVVVR